MKNIQREKIAVPGMIFLLTLLAYGLLSPQLGFYWDDWPFAWIDHFFGPPEFIPAFIPFRPFLGPIFFLTTSFIPPLPLYWQIFGLIIRFLLGLELWFIFRLIWPSRKWNSMWVVFLFTVYPGYLQQWVSFTHVNQEMIPLACLLASFAVTVYAFRNEHLRKRLIIPAIVLQVTGLFATEYVFGLEIFRFCFLIVLFSETLTGRDVLKKAFLSWLPYLCVWVLNAVWTYAYHHSTIYNSYDVAVASSLSPLDFGNEILNTLSLSGFISWVNTFQIFTKIDGTLAGTASLLMLIVSGAVLFLFMRPDHEKNMDQGSAGNDTWGLQVAVTGLIGIFAGRLPSWAAGLPLKIEFDYDRFMISIMLGASMFIVGLATLIFKEGRRKTFILSLLIGLSVAHQFSVSNTFRRDWENQRKFFWQLVWRMPSLQEDTVLLTHELPLTYVSDMQVTAPINWIYSPAITDGRMHYVLLYIKSRLHSSTLPSLQPDTPIHIQYRTATFDSTTSNSVVIYKDGDGCLRVLDTLYGSGETLPGANDFLLDAIRLSNPSRIQVTASQPEMDRVYFGVEPEHDWCYFYEKAELARQQSDWERVVKLYNQAQKNGYSPSVAVENLPFIEGFAITNQTDIALKLTERVLKEQKDLCPAIRVLWERVLKSPAIQLLDAAKINERILQSGCKPD